MSTHQASLPIAGVRKLRNKETVRSSEPMPPCPRGGCRGRLTPYPTAQSSYDCVTGLDYLRCAKCGHQGMRVPNGLHLVLRGPDEYVLHYPPMLTSLTIAVSPAILARFSWHKLTQTQIITFMAEWLLLTGRANGIVRFTEETVALDDCYDYFCRHIVRERCAETA